jgi:hypothetical protein
MPEDPMLAVAVGDDRSEFNEIAKWFGKSYRRLAIA